MYLNQPFCGFCICWVVLKLALWWYDNAFVFWQKHQILRVSLKHILTLLQFYTYSLPFFNILTTFFAYIQSNFWYKNCSASFNLNYYLNCNCSFLWLFFSFLCAYYVSFFQPHLCTNHFLLSFFFLYSTWAFNFIIPPNILYYMFL